MAVNTAPIFPLTPISANTSLAAVTACATRGPIATANLATNNLVALLTSQTNGARVDKIRVQACSTAITAATVAQIVQLWLYDGTNAYLVDEIQVTAVTPSTTVPAFSTEKFYLNFIIPTTYALYVSTTITTTTATTALQVTLFGGAY